MTDELSNTGEHGQGIKHRGMMWYQYCSCGHPIGMEKTGDLCRFYDNWDWNRQVETCPSCHCVIEEAGLDFSEEQSACLGRVYDYLVRLAHQADQSKE